MNFEFLSAWWNNPKKIKKNEALGWKPRMGQSKAETKSFENAQHSKLSEDRGSTWNIQETSKELKMTDFAWNRKILWNVQFQEYELFGWNILFKTLEPVLVNLDVCQNAIFRIYKEGLNLFEFHKVNLSIWVNKLLPFFPIKRKPSLTKPNHPSHFGKIELNPFEKASDNDC